MEEERLVKLEGLDICDLFYPVALLFQVIYLLLHVVEFTVGSVGNIGDVASQSSLEGGGVIEFYTSNIPSNPPRNKYFWDQCLKLHSS